MRQRKKIQEVLRQLKSELMNKVKRFTLIRCIGALMTGLLMTLVFPPYGMSALIWLLFIPFFFAVENVSWRARFFISYIAGLSFFTGLVYWLVHVTSIGVILLIGYLALYFPLFILSIHWLRNSIQLPFIISAPLVWCFIEYLRATVMTGFPWDNLGYAFYTSKPLMQVVEITGVTGLSALAVLGNVFVFNALQRIIRQKSRSRIITVTVIKILIPVLSFFAFVAVLHQLGTVRIMRLASMELDKKVRVALIQGNIPQYIKWDQAYKDRIMRTYDGLTRQAAEFEPDLIIWPESSLPVFFQYDDKGTYLIYSLVKELQIPLLFGGNRYVYKENKDYYFNSAYYVVPGAEIVQTYDKMHLVPYGEYIPNKKMLKKIIPKLESIVPFEDFTPGREMTVFEVDGTKFGVLVCYEDIFPELARLIPAQGADFIVNVTNDAWYMKTSAPYQHFAMASFRAVENRVPFIRCANTGITGYAGIDGSTTVFIGKNGSAIFEEGYLIADIPIYDVPPTFYTRHGELILYLASIISVLLLCVSFVYSLTKKRLRRDR
ncbi:MAG: apolipoprotein N-acyltransferase [Candidatus Auribacterota bacterium]